MSANKPVSESRFRGHVTAAPLKPGESAVDPERIAQIPRSRDRGPIEAAIARSMRAMMRRIPRSRDRGPIEASQQNLGRTIRIAGFRGHVTAAPLKPSV